MLAIRTLFSGSTGNCTLVRTNGGLALIDAGVSFRSLAGAVTALGLSVSDISDIFVTHEHIDHVRGLPMLMSKLPAVNVYMSAGTAMALAGNLGDSCDRIGIVSGGDALVTSDGTEVFAFRTSHDASESLGYIFGSEAGGKIGYATDMGYAAEDARKALCGCRVAVIEANHDESMLLCGRYPYSLKRRILSDIGHMSNESCGELARFLAENGTKGFILAHISQENNVPQLACETVRAYLRGIDCDVSVCAAPRNIPSDELCTL